VVPGPNQELSRDIRLRFGRLHFSLTVQTLAEVARSDDQTIEVGMSVQVKYENFSGTSGFGQLPFVFKERC